MARRHFSILSSVALLSLGLAAGGHLDSLRLTKDATAVPAAKPAGPRASQLATALLESGQHISDLAVQVLPSVVHIQAVRVENDRRIEETGSGVLVRSEAIRGLFVVTNQHVVRGAELESIDLVMPNGTEQHPYRVFRDSESDIAVLQVRDDGQAAATWGDSDSLRIGHFVLAVGSPFGLSQSITMGIVSAKGRRDLSLEAGQNLTNQDFLQTDAAINPGNSGGPLVDMYGNVVGINTAIASSGGGNEGIGFSIPSNLARRIVDQLVSTGRVRRAYLGVELDNDFSQNTAQRLGLRAPRGARIVRVYNQQNSPAVMAGLRPDDVVISFNGIDIVDENHLINLVSLADIGAPIEMVIFRGQQRAVVQVKLLDRESYRTASDPRGTFNTR